MQEWMTTEEVALHLRVSVETVRRWRSHGEGPPYVKPAGKALYSRDDLEAWVRSAGR